MLVIGLLILLAASAAVLSGWNFIGVSDMNTDYTENKGVKRSKEDKMKKCQIALGLAVLLLAAAGGLIAQTSPQDQQRANEAYAKAAAVTENHGLLKFFIGKWDMNVTMWAFPGTPPTMSKDATEVTAILGGRFIMAKVSGTMMGQPFEGVQINGYDNVQKKFLTFWIDNSSTTFFLLSGTYDAAKKTWTDTGRWADPMSGVTPVRAVTRIVGPDEYVYEMYMGLPDGKEFKSMEARYVRKK
jgi:hypothetical protein